MERQYRYEIHPHNSAIGVQVYKKKMTEEPHKRKKKQAYAFWVTHAKVSFYLDRKKIQNTCKTGHNASLMKLFWG